jgi:hypothetical protein
VTAGPEAAGGQQSAPKRWPSRDLWDRPAGAAVLVRAPVHVPSVLAMPCLAFLPGVWLHSVRGQARYGFGVVRLRAWHVDGGASVRGSDACRAGSRSGRCGVT